MDDKRVTAFIDALDAASIPEAAMELRSLDKREIVMRIVPWEVPALTRSGPEVIMRGAFGAVDPSKIVLQLAMPQVQVAALARGCAFGLLMTWRSALTDCGYATVAKAAPASVRIRCAIERKPFER